MKVSIKDFVSKCDLIRSFLKKSLMENFIFCAVYQSNGYQSNYNGTIAVINIKNLKRNPLKFRKAFFHDLRHSDIKNIWRKIMGKGFITCQPYFRFHDKSGDNIPFWSSRLTS